MRHSICAVLALVAACAAARPQDPDGAASPAARRVQWQRTLADAEALAKATGRPLLLALNMDGESASDRIWHENYRDPRFVALTRRCVCVGASVFRHNATDYDAGGRRIECPRLCGLTCGEHIALEPALFERFFTDGERVAPRHALVRADGSVAFDLSLCFDLTDIDRALAAATDGLEPWLPPTGDGWAALASRRDAAGRAALEAAVAAAVDPATVGEALAAIAAHGDAGALPALRLVLMRSPDAPLDALQATAGSLGLAASWHAVLRDRAQRLGPLPGGLAPPADFAPLLAALAVSDAELRTRTWLCGLAALAPDAGDAPAADRIWGAVASVWSADVRGRAGQPPVSIAALLELGSTAIVGGEPLPRPGVPKHEPDPAPALHERLRSLDDALARNRDDVEVLGAAGIASLDLGVHQLDAGDSHAPLFFEDADRYLQRALAAAPDRYEWWIQRARATYYLQRFDEEREHGVQALRVRGFAWPHAAAELPALVQDAEAIEAVRWIGDADARRFAAVSPDDPVAAIGTLRSALTALGLAAVSPYGRGRDFVGFASLLESLGLLREELAVLAAAQRRLPNDGELRQALATALWNGGRWQLVPELADAAVRPAVAAEASWWAGYARLQVAEELRRRERPRAAVAQYADAAARFVAAAEHNPAYADNVRGYVAASWLGRGHALAQGPAADRRGAAACLAQAVATGADLSALRDGLGYDALDLVDKLLEWRAGGPGPVEPLALLDELAAFAGDSLPFWAAAVSDSALREALRADGRNPERVEAETVDASGRPMRTQVGLPTELGDRYLDAAIAAGERAVAAASATGDERTVLAQACTIRAERQLTRDKGDGVLEALQRAAELLGVDLSRPKPDAGGDLDALRALAAPLRERLGPARPRWREGR